MIATVRLQPGVAEQIASLIDKTQSDADSFVDQALRSYLAQSRHEKIQSELLAFTTQFERLLANYAGMFVAIHQGEVIDQDANLRDLHLRVFKKVGHTPVLLKKVAAEAARELVFRSPHFA